MKNILNKRNSKKGILLALLCAAAAMVLGSCSGSGSSDDSPETETYTGSFTVSGESYNSLTVTGGTYTMTGSGTSDSGTYSTAASVLADGTYTFTSNKHHGTYTVTISGNTITITAGTLNASGSGTKKVVVTVTSNDTNVETRWITVQAGTFNMGCSLETDVIYGPATPVHQVTLTKSFIMCDHEVTVGDWISVMGSLPMKVKDSNGSTVSDGYKESDLPFVNNSHAVRYISWNNAINYCNALSVKENLTPAYTVNGNDVTWNPDANGYRLPTEAEWEYAARAGNNTTDARIWSGTANESEVTNYIASSFGRVKSKAPNAWGLYDMSGHLCEWCWDLYGDYPNESVTDPAGPSSSQYNSRVARGGSCRGYGDDSYGPYVYKVTVTRRDMSPSSKDVCFRVVRNAQ